MITIIPAHTHPTSGYMGMMLSPAHLCFLVTKDYFKAAWPSLMPAMAGLWWN